MITMICILFDSQLGKQENKSNTIKEATQKDDNGMNIAKMVGENLKSARKAKKTHTDTARPRIKQATSRL